MTGLDDQELLAEYARSESEAAFVVLVARYVNLVYSAALRYTGNPHHAEEITQAVFVILVHKAGKLSPRVVLSGWLYQTARLTAGNFVKGEIRRQRREQEAYMQSTLTEPEPAAWEQIAPLLDEAMGRLGETDRNAVVLRFFENKTALEVAAKLKLSESAAHKRVSRALEKLRQFFVQRGIASTTAGIAGVISANSVQAAPVALVHTATAVAVAKGATASGSTLALIKGALKVMAWTKAKTVLVASVVVLAAAGTATVTVHRLTQKRANPFEEFDRQMRQKPGWALTSEAARFVARQKHEGRLPGFPDGGPSTIQVMIHNMTQDSNGIWNFGTNDGETYPVSRTVHASKNNDGQFIYFYTVVKASTTNEWQLQKAWRADTDGQVAEEFPVP